MPKIQVSVLPFLCLLTCSPGFSADDMPPKDASTNPDAGRSMLSLSLTGGSFEQSVAVGVTNQPFTFNMKTMCPVDIGGGVALEATNANTCAMGTGILLVKCKYQIPQTILDDPAVKKGKSLSLRYSEDRLLPFNRVSNNNNFDAIQSWAAVSVNYASGSSNTSVSVPTTLNDKPQSQSETRLLPLSSSVDKDTTITFSTFVSCTNVKEVSAKLFSNSNCTIPSNTTCNTSKLAESNLSQLTTGTFSWKVSNLESIIDP